MTDDAWRVDELGRLARVLGTAPDDETRLTVALEYAARLVPGCDHASLIAVWRGRYTTARASGDQAVLADQLQYDADEGPCLDALRSQEPVVVTDIADDDRWPTWARRALAESSVRASLSAPLRGAGAAFGSLNLYADRPRAFAPDDLGTTEALADSVAAALSAGREIEQLSTALRSRTVIGQAEGILMERLDIDPEQAFAYLRRTSQDLNRKLVDLATEIVRTRELPRRPDDSAPD